MLQYGPNIFHWVHVRAVRRPRKNAIGKVFLEVTLNVLGGVFWIVILLENPLVTQQCIGILVEVVVQDSAVQVAVKVLCEEMDADFPRDAHRCPNVHLKRMLYHRCNWISALKQVF